MRGLDREAVEQYGIDEMLLMENAGGATVSVMARELGRLAGRTITLVCGGGNNGGDGFVIARKLLSAGALPRVIIAADSSKYRGAAARNLRVIENLPLQRVIFEGLSSVLPLLEECDAVVDALLGTGIDRPVRDGYADLIDAVNASGKRVFSVDIPSGVNGDTGAVMGTAVRASCTVTYGLPKIGNLLYPGYALGGKLFLSHISFPPDHYSRESLKIALNEPPVLPTRDPAGHKGDFGKALFIAGAAAYYGAPLYSSLAFLRAGGGYSRLAAPKSIIPSLATQGSEVVFVPQEETAAGSIAASNAKALLNLSDEADMVIIGPGISLDDETQRLVLDLAARIGKPVLCDGDGITALCRDPGVLKSRTSSTILTPHLGEFSRITGKSVNEIEADRIGCLRQAAAELKAVVVMKGAHSLIGLPDGRVLINTTGNPGMATAGSGDVLAGTIAAMHGLGLSPDEAVAKGVFIHGLAGDLAALKKGEDGMTARDILDCLPEALACDRRGLDERLQERYGIETVYC
jgi:NAD(P)H-hydrate epimerase